MDEGKVFDGDYAYDGIQGVMRQRLQRLGEGSYACLSTAEGQLVATTLDDQDRGARYSALSSALLGLCETFCKEAMGESSGEAFFSSGKGHAVLMCLELNGRFFQLCVVSSAGNNMATVLRETRDMGSSIKSHIESESINNSYK
jgi:predicted regulator of Ras-like GTPase activity (Roadblock/LC7/MglB family)